MNVLLAPDLYSNGLHLGRRLDEPGGRVEWNGSTIMLVEVSAGGSSMDGCFHPRRDECAYRHLGNTGLIFCDGHMYMQPRAAVMDVLSNAPNKNNWTFDPPPGR
jgi:hypothetical protein